LAVLVSIHDLNLAARYCDRLAVLHCGQLVVDARPSEALSTRVLHNVFEVEAQLVSDPSLNGAVQVQVRGLSPRLT
jgi:iron complex transport system ATP-binding protein